MKVAQFARAWSNECRSFKGRNAQKGERPRDEGPPMDGKGAEQKVTGPNRGSAADAGISMQCGEGVSVLFPAMHG